MAYGEFGGLLPRESSFRTPEAYRESMIAEARQKGSYLSQMDQFYAQLEETSRQFDETMGFQQEQLEQQKEQFEISSDLDWAKLDLQRDLGFAGLEEDRYRTDTQVNLGFAGIEQQDEQLDWMREQFYTGRSDELDVFDEFSPYVERGMQLDIAEREQNLTGSTAGQPGTENITITPDGLLASYLKNRSNEILAYHTR